MPRGRCEPLDSTPEFETLVEGAAQRVRYGFRLYVTGTIDRSIRAITNGLWFCERYLKERYDLLVVDIYQQPALAQTHEIIAAPTLVKSKPRPSKRLVGAFSDSQRLVAGLGIQKEKGG